MVDIETAIWIAIWIFQILAKERRSEQKFCDWEEGKLLEYWMKGNILTRIITIIISHISTNSLPCIYQPGWPNSHENSVLFRETLINMISLPDLSSYFQTYTSKTLLQTQPAFFTGISKSQGSGITFLALKSATSSASSPRPHILSNIYWESILCQNTSLVPVLVKWQHIILFTFSIFSPPKPISS